MSTKDKLIERFQSLPSDFTFEANKKYNLRIYLPRFYRADGQAFIEGAVIPD